MSLHYKQGPITLGDRFLLGFGGALAGLLAGVLLFVMVNWTMYRLHGAAPQLQWHYLPFYWAWRIAAFCAVFAFVATETFVQVISAVWDVMTGVIKFWMNWRWWY